MISSLVSSVRRLYKSDPSAAVRIAWKSRWTSFGSIAQVYSRGPEYCFISPRWRQCHDFVFCKDFLQDAVMAHLHGERASIFGFSYDPRWNAPLCAESTRIAVANASDPKFLASANASLEFVNHYAARLKLKRTVLRTVANVPSRYSRGGVVVFDGSPMWMNAPPMLSMFALLLRVGMTHQSGEDPAATTRKVLEGRQYQTNDMTQLRMAQAGIEKITKLGYRKFFFIDPKKNFPKGTPISTMHGLSGIVAFSNGSSRSVVKYWHRKSLDKQGG